jgi:glycosyltransferase involved in cell wall biosynthesis
MKTISIFAFTFKKRDIPKRLLFRTALKIWRSDCYWCFFPYYVRYSRFPCVIDYDDPLSTLKPEFAEVERKTLNNSIVKFVVTPTEPQARYLSEKVGIEKTKIRVISHSVDTGMFQPICEPDEKVVGFCGSLSPIRSKFLLEAMDYVWSKMPDVTFLITGSKVELPQRKIISLGSVPFKSLPIYINKMSVCLGFTHFKRFSGKLQEYMACGRPIVANNVEENRSVLKANAGFLVNSPKEMGEAVIRLLENPELRAEMGKNGREYAVKNFSVERLAAEYYGLFQEACEKF